METVQRKMNPLINTRELKDRFTSPDLRIIDARSGKDAFERYAAQHIKGALHVDLDKDLAAPPVNAAHGGRHPLPVIQHFAQLLGRLGIQPTSSVVVYDDKNGANAAARFWWMLRSAGHAKVQALNGGWQAAVKDGIDLSEAMEQADAAAAYPVAGWLLPVVDLHDVAAAALDADHLVIDVREAYRYKGESEPIDLVAGHIPHAVNIPYLENLAPDGKFLPAAELAEIYQAVIGNRHPDKIIVHCGSGVTACHTLLALEVAGISGANLYVGSWSEWSRNELPVAKGDQ